MRDKIQKLIMAGLLTAAFQAMGCPGGPASEKMIVKGKVTIDDGAKSPEGVTLSFYGPDDKAASGVVTTQADGTYEVMFNTSAGEGNYKVTASKSPPGGTTIQKGEGIDDFQLGLAAGASAKVGGLPARYADVASSGLSTPLQKGTNEGKNFALKSK